MTSACIKHQRDMHALVPGHVSNIKGICMPWSQGMYQTSKGNTCPPLSAWCCSMYTVTTGTLYPPTHRDISILQLLVYLCYLLRLWASFNLVLPRQLHICMTCNIHQALQHNKSFCCCGKTTFKSVYWDVKVSAPFSYLFGPFNSVSLTLFV